MARKCVVNVEREWKKGQGKWKEYKDEGKRKWDDASTNIHVLHTIFNRARGCKPKKSMSNASIWCCEICDAYLNFKFTFGNRGTGCQFLRSLLGAKLRCGGIFCSSLSSVRFANACALNFAVWSNGREHEKQIVRICTRITLRKWAFHPNDDDAWYSETVKATGKNLNTHTSHILPKKELCILAQCKRKKYKRENFCHVQLHFRAIFIVESEI